MTALLTADAIARLPETEFERALRAITPALAARLARFWPFWARDGQMPPAGEWRTWLVMAGRGFGKTRMGAEWVRSQAERDGSLRIALIGATLGEARAVMVEGESGLLAIAGEEERPEWEPSLRRLRWESGAQAFLYSGNDPDSLRGPQHHIAWCDEIAKWAHGAETWQNLELGLRLGSDPRAIATTTPRPVPLVRMLAERGDTALTRGRTRDNAGHLPPAFLGAMEAEYGGTRIGRQELDGELIADAAGTLWPRALIERARVRAAPAAFDRIVIGVDPPAGAAGGDACGIVAVGRGTDGAAYVIEDCSVAGASPEGWALAVAEAAGRHKADRVVAEKNMGGAMVESVLRAAQRSLPLRLVSATRGKVVRAEPVAALYERGRAFHVGAFPALEDEMAGLIMGGGYEGPGRSPDRADALVWAMTELMLGRAPKVARVRGF